MDARGFGKFNSVIFIFTVLIVEVLSLQSRSVNLAVETSFLFDPQDIKENTTFINRVQHVIDKIKNAISPNQPVFRQSPSNEHTVLTKFLGEIGSSLITFDNNDIIKITNDLNDVVQSYANKSDFHEMVEDKRLRAFIKNTAKEWSVTDPMVLKVEIAKYITSVDTNTIVKFINLMNKLFDDADEAKIKKLLKKFTKAKKKKEFAKFLSKAIDFVIFKRYQKSNFLLKQILKQEMIKLANYVSATYEYRVRDENDPNFRRLSLVNIGRSRDVHHNQEEIEDSSYNNNNNSIELSIKTESVSNKAKQSEILIDKDLQLNVRANDKSISLNMT